MYRKELLAVKKLIREYSRRSKSRTFNDFDLHKLYKQISRLSEYLDSVQYNRPDHLCKNCKHWNPPPAGKHGYCSKGKGFTLAKEFCSCYDYRTEEQCKLDRTVRRKLNER